MATTNKIHSTTQQFLDIFDVTNDFMIMADGAVSLVITVSAMNFGLLSESEQDATIYAYAALLNSLSFPIEIVIRSQPKDVTNYLKLIQQKEDEIVNPLYRQRIKEYRSFVESLVQEQNVLDKKFYIAIPLSAVEMGLASKSVLPGAKSSPISSYEKSFIIDKARTNLIPRRDHLVDQLARIGLYSRQLTTQDLIQLLYSSYNPESFEGLKVTDTQNYTTPLIQAQILGDPSMIDPNMQTPIVTSVTPPASVGPVPVEQPIGVQQPAIPQPSTFTTPVTESPVVTPVVTPIVQAQPSAPVVTPAATTTTFPIASSAPSVVPPESPLVSTPNVSPLETTVAAAVKTEDPQAMINQTLSQLGTSTPAAPVTPTAIPEI